MKNQQNEKSSQMSNEKQFDFATIAVIIVSLGLILGGFYLLNQSFTSKPLVSKQTTTSSKTSLENLSKSSSTSEIDQTKIDQKSSSQLITSSSQKSSSDSSRTTSSSAISSSVSSSSSSLSSQISSLSSSTSSGSTTPSSLQPNQAIIKVISVQDSGYLIETTDTSYKDGRLWKVSKQLKINSTKPLTSGSEYLVSDISEGANSVQFGSIIDKK